MDARIVDLTDKRDRGNIKANARRKYEILVLGSDSCEKSLEEGYPNDMRLVHATTISHDTAIGIAEFLLQAQGGIRKIVIRK